MDDTTVITALISALVGGGLWKVIEQKFKLSRSMVQIDHETEAVLRDNLIQRVDRLEDLLMKASDDKSSMRHQIQELTIQVTELKLEIKYLRDENKKLREAKLV